jgi:hypothetical protein
MQRYLTIAFGSLLAILFLATASIFLTYVPAIHIVTVAFILLGFVMMFLLGIQMGSRRIRVSRLRSHSY